jgi:16S rRNA (adenine1518-N6/adenine1519-N6)-dimethyltransferase
MAPYPRKQFSQHWLRSDKVLHEILTAAQITQGDRLLEIGPGTGILTQWLLPLTEFVLAVEVDRDLCQLLAEKFKAKNNFLLLQGDFLALDLDALVPTASVNKVVANIPYHITGPILEKLLGAIAKPALKFYELIVLLVQKEVAERLCAKPGSKIFGALSVRVQYLAACEWICEVPARAFYPPPKVDSAVVRLIPRQLETLAQNPRHLETLVKLGFATKRKMLRNNLKSILERDRLSEVLEQLKINPQVRAEDLGVEQWVALSNFLQSSPPS